jgi:hypothetical protein
VPPIEVLEQLLLAPAKAPIRQLLPPCVATADEVRAELRALGDSLLGAPALARFPRLRARVRDDLAGLLGSAHAETVAKLGEMVAMEEAYISTEDAAFLAELAAAVRKLVGGSNPAVIREILKSYFSTVQRSLSNGAPKCIMLLLVAGVRGRLHGALFDGVSRSQLGELLDEPDDVRERRHALQARLGRLRAAISELETTARRAQPAGAWR